jgi:hypothetical protein
MMMLLLIILLLPLLLLLLLPLPPPLGRCSEQSVCLSVYFFLPASETLKAKCTISPSAIM